MELVVVGSVAVDRRTGRRIGKGEGFADLEWALAASNHGGAVSKNTLVATTVHDCQGSNVNVSDPMSFILWPQKVLTKKCIWFL